PGAVSCALRSRSATRAPSMNSATAILVPSCRRSLPRRTSEGAQSCEPPELFARDDFERRLAGERRFNRQRGEIALMQQRDVKLGAVAPARYLDCSEGAQMISYELRIEQHEAARDQARDEMHQRNLGSIAFAVEHALAEERA